MLERTTYEPEFSVVLLSSRQRVEFQALDDKLRLDTEDLSHAAMDMGDTLARLQTLLGARFVSFVNTTGMALGTARRLIAASEYRKLVAASGKPLFGYLDRKTFSKIADIGLNGVHPG